MRAVRQYVLIGERQNLRPGDVNCVENLALLCDKVAQDDVEDADPVSSDHEQHPVTDVEDVTDLAAPWQAEVFLQTVWVCVEKKLGRNVRHGFPPEVRHALPQNVVR